MSKLTKNQRIDKLVACLRTQGIKMRELETRLSTQEKWSDYADNMLDELNHALPDPEYDAKCEAEAADVDASLDRHRERLGLNKPQLKQLDQSDDIAKELLEIDLSSELTGSDLARAMFERGDNYIMCVVGTIKEVVIIDTFQDGYFYSKGVRYLNPKPINNQGEPLTAAEAGF